MDSPLVVCDSYTKRDRLAKFLYLEELDDIPVEMDQNHVTEYGGGGISLYMTVPRTPDFEVGFMNMASRLFRRFRGHIVFFTDDPKVSNIFQRYVGERRNIVLNPPVDYLPSVLGIRLTDHQRAGLLEMPHTDPLPVLTLEEEDDSELQRALRQSEEEERMRREAEEEKKDVPLKREWEKVLKKGELPSAAPGEPMCIVCIDKRASILYTRCDHQVICDECFRIYFTRPNLRHECQVCRAPIDQINRPMYGRIQEQQETTTRVTKRQRTKK